MSHIIQNSLTSNGSPYQMSSWFPTGIYIAPNLITPEENQFIIDKLKNIEKTVPQGGDNWLGVMYNTCGTYDLKTDKDFDFFFEKVHEHTNEYTRILGSSAKYECQDSWVNISYEHAFQEYHTHADCTISACYYASVPENSGRILFESPLEPDMLPVKKIDNYNYWSHRTAHFTPEAGMLIIFRSYLRHMVEVNKSKDPRISIAMNF
jgi:uncharacterized protein (TIGR02466 family)